ncbi:MAG: hypothetical protein ABUS54_08745 [Actinomycetota bacterium]
MEVRKPTWATSTFLLYAGAFAVLSAAGSASAYLSASYGDVAYVGWTLLMLVVLAVLGHVMRPWVAAGLFAFLSVSALGTFVGAVFEWWGWNGGSSRGGPFDGWHWAQWLLIVIVLVASFVALGRTRFPLLVLPIALLIWFLVTDVVSGGGSWTAVVTLLFGGLYFLIGMASNRVYGFWWHVVAGGLVAGALVYWWHSSTADWWLLAVASVVAIQLGSAVRRSSWAVYGTIGLFAAGVHFSFDWADTGIGFVFGQGEPPRVWVPIVVAAAIGFLLVLLGLRSWQRQPAE